MPTGRSSGVTVANDHVPCRSGVPQGVLSCDARSRGVAALVAAPAARFFSGADGCSGGKRGGKRRRDPDRQKIPSDTTQRQL